MEIIYRVHDFHSYTWSLGYKKYKFDQIWANIEIFCIFLISSEYEKSELVFKI